MRNLLCSVLIHTNIGAKMDIICLKLLLNVALIFIVARATFAITYFTTDTDYGNCTSASHKDRLPRYIMEPKDYYIIFTIMPNYDSFLGESNILIHVIHRTKTIRLHAYKIRMSLNEIYLRSVHKEAEQEKIYFPVGYRYCTKSQMLDLHFKDDIYPALYYLSLNFTAPLNAKEYEGLTWHENITCETPQG